MATELQSGSSKLRPRARIIRTIGEELISNDIVAIIELVKNSYDADAQKVKIIFQGKIVKDESKKEPFAILPEQGSITIQDNGNGMSIDTIKNAWMEPATTIKKIEKKSGKGRRLVGEKGVGRFASARLSQSLEMITRVKNDNEIFTIFNWADFSDDKYLDEIDCIWEVRKPEVIKEKGTVLVLENLNFGWDADKLRRLRAALSRLINPVSPVEDFEIELCLPEELSFLAGRISSPVSLVNPNYSITGNVNDKGLVCMKYSSRKKSKTEEIRKQLNLKPVRHSDCGSFDFEFRVWDREAESLKALASELGSTLKNIKTDLNEASGISLYRDNFRVMPYGESNNDWLRLDFRRVNNPTMRLSNNQIVGYVCVSLDNNPKLRDQSNREGIIETQAFSDMKEMIIACIAELETKRYDERPREEKKDGKEGLFAGMNIAPVAEMVSRKLPGDKDAQKIVAEIDKKIKEGVKRIQEVVARYRRLATLGQLLDVILHDGNSILLKIDNEAKLLEKEFSKEIVSEEKVQERINLIKQERKVLSELFRRLEPFGGRKRGRPKEIILEEAIKSIFILHSSEIERLKVRFTLPDSKTVVNIDESEFEMIILNLLQNSLYWMETIQDKDRKIVVEVISEGQGLSLIFSDNGLGVEPEYADRIWEPYFSRKPEGIGLGLTHIGELVTEYGGTLDLISGGPLDGATFKLTFLRRV